MSLSPPDDASASTKSTWPYLKQAIGTVLVAMGALVGWAHDTYQSLAKPTAGLTVRYQIPSDKTPVPPDKASATQTPQDRSDGFSIWQYQVLNPHLVTLKEIPTLDVWILDEVYQKDKGTYSNGLIVETPNAVSETEYHNNGHGTHIRISHKHDGHAAPLKPGTSFQVNLIHPKRGDWAPTKVELSVPGRNPDDITHLSPAWSAQQFHWIVYILAGALVGSGIAVFVWGFVGSKKLAESIGQSLAPVIRGIAATFADEFREIREAEIAAKSLSEQASTNPQKAVAAISDAIETRTTAKPSKKSGTKTTPAKPATASDTPAI